MTDAPSRRASGGSGAALPPDAPTFFVDYCLGAIDVPSALRALGPRVEVHQDHFANDAADAGWIATVAERGWIILTKDRRVRHRPIEHEALRSNDAAAFILTAGDLLGAAQARAFTLAAPKMLRIVAKYARPVLATVTRSGGVAVLEGERRGEGAGERRLPNRSCGSRRRDAKRLRAAPRPTMHRSRSVATTSIDHVTSAARRARQSDNARASRARQFEAFCARHPPC